MTYPKHVVELQGQAYVVLRPRGSIEDLFRETLRTLRQQLEELPITHPNSAHVTIRGYPTGVDLMTVNRVVDEWASGLVRLELNVQRIGIFDAPAKVVILEIEKTPELSHAFTRLLDLSEGAALPSFEAAPQTADAWTFHVSVLYGKNLSDDSWNAVRTITAGLESPPATYTAKHAELVNYSESGEQARIVPFITVARCDES